MKISLRISLIMSGISVATICLLTILMHFRYNITRANLINDRIGVTSASIDAVVDNNLKTGIPIASQSDIYPYILKKKESEKIIADIHILKSVKDGLEPAFQTGESDLPSSIRIKAAQKMKISKSRNWSFNEMNLNTKMNYVGLTLKGPTGIEVGAIIVNYDGLLLEEQGKYEIYNLYKRMCIAMLFTVLISFLIGYKTIKKLDKTIESVEMGLDRLSKNEKTFDLSEIADPTLKGNFRKALTNASKVTSDLTKIEELLISAEKEDTHG